MSMLIQDLKFAVRTLRRTWGLTLVAVLSLAVTIGGNTAVFSMVDALLFQPIPFHEPERLVLFGERPEDTPSGNGGLGNLPSHLGGSQGAFTGAVKDQDGLFGAAHGGTLFLDEIGDAPPGLQQRLLRALQEKEVTPVGSTKPVSVDVRLIAATHRDLRAAVGR